jgi:ABC-type lipoprotein export system ATPase subunit
MKPEYEKCIQRTIKTYTRKCDLLLTKERLKQYITLTIRKDIASQALLANIMDTVFFAVKTSLMRRQTPLQMAILTGGIIFSTIDTLREMSESIELNQEVTVQTQLHNQRCHDMISCYLNVAENKNKEGRFHDDVLIEEILCGIDDCTTKMLNDSHLSKTRLNRHQRQHRMVAILMSVFKDASILNTLYETNYLINGWLNTCFNLSEIYAAIKELRMDELEPHSDKRRGNVDWTKLNNPDVPLFSIKKFKFCYPDTDKVVLKNESDTIHIQQNRWIQIKGPSGSGKSTLIKLFLKTIETETPKSFVFMGHNDYEFLSIREFVSTNSVGNGLFYETVEYNVYYSINHRDDDLVRHYFHHFNIGDFDAEREKNINMMSSGQQQKIKVIRIVLLILQRLYEPEGRHKQIFFLDEPTANMDPHSEQIVLNELKALREKFSLSFMFVSHSVAAMKFADEFLVIGDDRQLYTESKEAEDAIVLDLCDDMVTNEDDVTSIKQITREHD